MPRIEQVKKDKAIKEDTVIENVKEKPDFRKYLNVYEFDVTLPSGLKVKVKPVNAGQLKKFISTIKENSLKEISRAMYNLLQASVINYDIGEIYLNDRPYLILELRKVSKGSTYETQYTCDKCKSQSLINFDLNDLKIIPIPDKINPIVELDENLSVVLDFVKIKDEQEIMGLGLKTESDLLLSVIAVSIKSIITPEGEQNDLDLKERLYFTDEIPQMLYEKLTSWHDEYSFGVEMSQKVTCVHCGKESDFTIDADNFFF